MAALTFEVDETSQAQVVRVGGTAGITEADALDLHLTRLLAQQPKCVVFELSDLKFVSSLTLGMFVRARHALERNGGWVALAAARPEIEQVLRRCGLDHVFQTFPSVDAAIDAHAG